MSQSNNGKHHLGEPISKKSLKSEKNGKCKKSDKCKPDEKCTHFINMDNFCKNKGMRITESGIWELSCDLIYHGCGYAITIDSNDVILDFNGHSLDLEFTGNNAILISPQVDNVTIKDGSILRTGPEPIPTVDWNVGPNITYPGSLQYPGYGIYPTGGLTDPNWTLRPEDGFQINGPASVVGKPQYGAQALIEFFRTGDLFGKGTLIGNPYTTFPCAKFSAPPQSVGIEISNTSNIHITNMKFLENYVCIDAVNGPVRNLTVDYCMAKDYGRKILKSWSYPGSEYPTFNITGTIEDPPIGPDASLQENIVYFGDFINMITRDGAAYIDEVRAPRSKNVFITNNTITSNKAGHGVYINPADKVVFRFNTMDIPDNHDGWERNENWGITITNVQDAVISDNVFFHGIHCISPWGCAAVHVENNQHLDTYEQGMLWKVCSDFICRNNQITYHSEQFKHPAGSSLTFAGNDPVTGMAYVGYLNQLGMTYIQNNPLLFPNIDPNLKVGTPILGQPNPMLKSTVIVDPTGNNQPDAAPLGPPVVPLAPLPVRSLTIDWYVPTNPSVNLINPFIKLSSQNGWTVGVDYVDPVIQDNATYPALNPPQLPNGPNGTPFQPLQAVDPRHYQFGSFDHNDGFMMFQCKNGIFEDNSVIGINDANSSAMGYEFNGSGDTASLNLIVRNNLAIGNKGGFRILFRGTAGGVAPSIQGATQANPSGTALSQAPSAGFQFYGNQAFGNGSSFNGVFYPADYVEFVPFIGANTVNLPNYGSVTGAVAPIVTIITATTPYQNLASNVNSFT